MSDVIVVGGGPAGACLAIMLGRRGLDVELYEQARFPRDKPCGEGLLPPGVRVLRSLGLDTSVGGEPLAGVRYHVNGDTIRSDFGSGESKAALHGLGQKRLVLDAALWAEALKTPGVRAADDTRIDAPLVERQRVTGVIVDGETRRARLVVAADGASSGLRRLLGLERTAARRRVGIRAHFRRPRDQPALSDIEIFMRAGYELYVTPLPGNEMLVAALAYQDAVRGSLRTLFQRWVWSEPLLRGWLEGASQTSELSGRAPLVRHSTRRPPDGLVLLGDAASSVDPITAGGMTLALVGAELLAKELPAMLSGSTLARFRFERAREGIVRDHRWLGKGLLTIAERPRLASLVRRFMQACPRAMRALVDVASGGGRR
jgi:menaquinone-9 beta-reductase